MIAFAYWRRRAGYLVIDQLFPMHASLTFPNSCIPDIQPFNEPS